MNSLDELKKCVSILIFKASDAKTAIDALQLSQAACNAANAITQLQYTKEIEKLI